MPIETSERARTMKKKRSDDNPVKKRITRQYLFDIIVSFLICYGVLILGILYNKADRISSLTAIVLLIVLGLFPVIMTLVFWFVNRRIKKKYDLLSEDAAASRSFFLSRRENAAESAKTEAACLHRTRVFTALWAIILGLIALGFAFVGGASPSVMVLGFPFSIYATVLFYCSLTELFHYFPSEPFIPSEDELKEADCPMLYSLARRAQTHVGGNNKIRIFWNYDPVRCVGIASYGDTLALFIDIVTLNILNEDELYSVFLHEFAHVDSRNAENNSIKRYANYLSLLSSFPSLPFALRLIVYILFYNSYNFHFQLYSFASSIDNENYADSMMSESPLPAATSLLKIQYYGFFFDECETNEQVLFVYQSEQPPEHLYFDRLALFRETLPSRRDFWNGLIKKEIIALNASHPTIYSRIQALGFDELPDTDMELDEAWRAECEKALHAADALTLENVRPVYQKDRKESYLEPLARIQAWEEAGRPIVAEEYADIMEAMLEIRRFDDALALMEEAIAALPGVAALSAYFQRGRIRLNRYDTAGLEDIYTAMEENENFIPEGLDIIGDYCCKMGLQEELTSYREKALVYSQKRIDESDKITSIDKKDKLSAEQLPDGVLEEILKYIESVSEGIVDKVYLFRKTVSDNFFASTVVLKFDIGTKPEKKSEILHRVFRYLDTSSDWQYTLFEYYEVPKDLLANHPEFLVWQKTDGTGNPVG